MVAGPCRVVICVRSLSLTHSLVVRARDQRATTRAREREEEEFFPSARSLPRRFIHSKKSQDFVCAGAIWHGEGSESIGSQEVSSGASSRRQVEGDRPRALAAKTPAAEHRFLKTQLMLFGIGLCQIFDDPDLRQ